MAVRLTLVFCLAISCTTVNAETASYSAEQNLRNFALSTCLAQAFSDSPAGADAKKAAGAYVEIGALDAEAYVEAASLAKVFLQKKYKSKSGVDDLVVMKCIDLMNSREMGVIAERYILELKKRTGN